ncbi:hypothetical protein [Hymenobacter volaticus]|uniref:DUF2157 domain-containing protein n=1 Tax=Hymenobacter volaticus TaxID=2932254 RepID=A0ABY4G784_9BACT|nr:hypothetical protein [Hymenobacter volaticus]UOQ66741.1 hypothetical protein MUN86_02085 [Hymenobacter volaticus]
MNWKAYNPNWAHREAVRAAATRWQKRGLLSSLQLAAIVAAHPLDYYRPNIFLRITLFIFTIIGLSAASGFMALLFSGGFHSGTEEVMLVTIAVLTIAGGLVLLEFAIKDSHLYHSGIDNAILYYILSWTVFLLAYIIYELAPIGYRASSSLTSPNTNTLLLLTLPVLLAATVRYADRLVAAAAYATYLLLLASVLLRFPIGRLLLPFVVMLASAAAYFLVKKLAQRPDYLYYKPCLQALKVLSLVTFYLGGNYWVVREGNALLSDTGLSTQVPFAWLFYFLTAGIPIAYLVVGLRRHDRIWLLVGILLVAFSVFTFRHYYSVLPAEIAATLAGAVLIASMIGATRYLRTPRHGLTTAADDEDDTRKINLESLIVAQTANVPQPAEAGFEFGGGRSGGGGAEGTY